jgi:phosphopantothenoylcysteine decarboxylase / phosphopantothenate---cysteine ligase
MQMATGLTGRRIVLGVTGGVAAFKSCELVRLLTKAGVQVQVVMTEAATKFIAPATFQALSGRKVFIDQWDNSIDNNMAHIELSRVADAIMIAPASADFMGKINHGLANDLLSTLVLARNCPLLLAPAMNREMWANPATQRNAAQLRADGIALLGPAVGEQACGETGEGRMLEAEELLAELEAFFRPKTLAGKQILITAGPTFEPIDPVRGITNLSSGKMGFAIARACVEAGANVTLVAGPTALETPYKVQRHNVQTAREMYAEVLDLVPGQDIFIAVAAVADWHVANASSSKLKKDSTGHAPALVFGENPDILASVAKQANAKGGVPYCVGFAAESEDLKENGSKKRERKACPLLVANIGHATFGRDDNALLLIDAEGMTELPRADKLTLARQLTSEIAQRIAKLST